MDAKFIAPDINKDSPLVIAKHNRGNNVAATSAAVGKYTSPENAVASVTDKIRVAVAGKPLPAGNQTQVVATPEQEQKSIKEIEKIKAINDALVAGLKQHPEFLPKPFEIKIEKTLTDEEVLPIVLQLKEEDKYSLLAKLVIKYWQQDPELLGYAQNWYFMRFTEIDNIEERSLYNLLLTQVRNYPNESAAGLQNLLTKDKSQMQAEYLDKKFKNMGIGPIEPGYLSALNALSNDEKNISMPKLAAKLGKEPSSQPLQFEPSQMRKIDLSGWKVKKTHALIVQLIAKDTQEVVHELQLFAYRANSGCGKINNAISYAEFTVVGPADKTPLSVSVVETIIVKSIDGEGEQEVMSGSINPYSPSGAYLPKHMLVTEQEKQPFMRFSNYHNCNYYLVCSTPAFEIKYKAYEKLDAGMSEKWKPVTGISSSAMHAHFASGKALISSASAQTAGDESPADDVLSQRLATVSLSHN